MRCIIAGDLLQAWPIQEELMASLLMVRRVFFLLTLMAVGAHASQTLYTQIPIPPQCEADYHQGNQYLTQLVSEGFDLGQREQVISKLDSALNTYSEEQPCRFYFSVGMFDAQGLLQQMATLEYFLELNQLEERNNPSALAAIKKLYYSRFKKLGFDNEAISKLDNNVELKNSSVKAITLSLNEIADSKSEAVFLGRFVFVGNSMPVLTLFDYDFDGSGNIKVDKNNQEQVVQGSYQRLAQNNFEHAVSVAKEYLEWRPSLFFGEDSFWYGSWNRYFGSPYEKSLREVKNDGYHNLFLKHLSFARKLRLETKEYANIYQLMLKKDRAVLERELGTYEKMHRYRWAPVLIPVGMYVGSALLVKSTFFMALPAETASFTLVGGNLALASNASAAVSLLTLGTYSGWGARAAYLDYKTRKAEGLPFHVVDGLDYIVGATYQAFPLAAIMPVIVGGSIYNAHEAFVATKSLLSQAISIGKGVQTLGMEGSLQVARTYLVQLPGKLVTLPQFVAQKWLEAWYKNPKLLLSSYGADIIMTLVFDCGYRQVNLEGKDVCVWKDEQGTHVNSQFLYSLSSTVIVGGVSKPVTLIPSFGLRWITYRGVTLLSGVVGQLIVSGHLDSKRLIFDQVYGAGPSSAKGEIERYVRMSDWVQQRSAAEQTLLIIALKALVLSPIESPIKIYFLERFVKGQLRPTDELKTLMKDVAFLSIDDFNNEVIEQAIEALKNEKEVIEAITSIQNVN